MDGIWKQNSISLSFLALIAVLNCVLAINFITASGSALAAAFDGKSIFLFAGIELIAVLITYVVAKNRRVNLYT